MTGCTRDTPRCEYWTQGDTYVRPACCTQHLVDLLFFTHRLLERHGIWHWLDFGSLLGAARSGELIPWDGDIDFGICRDDVERVRQLSPEVEAAGYWLNAESPYVVRVEFSRTNSLHADLFPWWLEDGLLKMRWPDSSSNTWGFPPQFASHLQPVMLCGGEFPAPAPLHEFLQRYRYGRDYMTPMRTEQLDLQASLAPRMRNFVAGKIYRQRLERNLSLLRETLGRTALKDLYEVASEPAMAGNAPAQQVPDAAVAYRTSHDRFTSAIPAITAAGFTLVRTERGCVRFAKDGACFDFFPSMQRGDAG